MTVVFVVLQDGVVGMGGRMMRGVEVNATWVWMINSMMYMVQA